MAEPHTVEVSFPMKGLDVSGPVTEQPEGTSAVLQNVRGYDAIAEMDRGGQRSGTTRAYDGEVDSFVQRIDQVVTSIG